MKLNLTVNLDKTFAREVASKLGMSLEISEPSEEELTGLPTILHREATDKEVEHFLEGKMKKSIIKIYSETVAEIKLAQLDEMRAKQEEAIKKEVGGAISVGAKVKKSSK